MTEKKIEFSNKPSKLDTEKFINNWVISEKKNSSNEKSLKRTTIYLPENIRKELKYLALEKSTSMTEIIIEALNNYLK